MSDELVFADDDQESQQDSLSNWKILIVDDEPEVHNITKLALSELRFMDRGIDFISAYSGNEAKELMQKHSDIAVVLLDVVMETDDSGLQVADYIRNQMNNAFTRIILRTGQPGQAPERDIILNYDINDYKSKTELTLQKMFTTVISSLRSYQDIIAIEANRQGLEKIVTASADLFSQRSLEGFINGLIQQLSSLLGSSTEAAYITSAVAASEGENDNRQFHIFTANGDLSNSEGKLLDEVLTPEQLDDCNKALESKSLVYGRDYIVAYCNSENNGGSLLYLTGTKSNISDQDRELLRVFTHNVQIAFENVMYIQTHH